MRPNPKSYLVLLILSLLIFSVTTDARAAQLFLDPDSVFVTGGAGTEFDLEVRVDAATTGLKLFQIRISVDPTKFDTVSISEGTLFTDAYPYNSIFYGNRDEQIG